MPGTRDISREIAALLELILIAGWLVNSGHINETIPEKDRIHHFKWASLGK